MRKPENAKRQRLEWIISFKGDQVSLNKFLSMYKINLSSECAWNYLYEIGVITSKNTLGGCVVQWNTPSFCDKLVSHGYLTLNEYGVKFNPRFLKEVFIDFLPKRGPAFMDFIKEELQDDA